MPVHGFRFYFTPLDGVLFAFPSRYFCAIGSCLVFSLGSWSTRIPAGFLVPRRTQVPHQEVRSISHTGLSPSSARLPRRFRYASVFYNFPGHPHAALQHRSRRFGLLRVRSPLLAESLLISIPGLLRWFTSSGVAPPPYFIRTRGPGIAPCGLPHSAVRGSMDMCSSPRLFAAYHGLLRLAAPRHSPWTYISLDHIIISARLSLLPRPMAFLSSIAMRALASMRTCFLLPSTSALFRASVSLPLSFQRSYKYILIERYIKLSKSI